MWERLRRSDASVSDRGLTCDRLKEPTVASSYSNTVMVSMAQVLSASRPDFSDIITLHASGVPDWTNSRVTQQPTGAELTVRRRVLTCVLGRQPAPGLQSGEGGLHGARGEADLSVDEGEALSRWRARGHTGLLHGGRIGGAVGGQGAPHRTGEGGGAEGAGHMVGDGGCGLEGGKGLP